MHPASLEYGTPHSAHGRIPFFLNPMSMLTAFLIREVRERSFLKVALEMAIVP
jgi:hypothetical protein